jgi:hypothetical protein
LTEEKIYDDEVEEYGNNVGVNIFDVNPMSNKRKDKIKVNKSKLYFGFFRLTMVLILCILMVVVTQFFYFLILSPTAAKIDGLMKIFIYSVESWSVLASLHSVFFRTVMWNNSIPTWGNDSLSTFNYFSDRLTNELIPNFTNALEYNMGNYSHIYEQQFTKVSQILPKMCLINF